MKRPHLLTAAGIGIVALGAGGYSLYRYERFDSKPGTDLYSLGQQAAGRGDCALAIDYFKTFLASAPGHVQALDFMAQCQARTGDLKGAALSFEAILPNSGDRKYRYQLAGIYKQLGRHTDADALLASPSPSPVSER